MLKEGELDEGTRIFRVAFGTFLGLPNPLEFMGDRHMILPRWKSSNATVLAAHDGDRLIGTNVVTRWGTFGFFGPLTVLPEYWDRGVAQRLLEATEKVFARWRLRRMALCTFPQSPKHIGLYAKFGYWPDFLTPVMTRAAAPGDAAPMPTLLSGLKPRERSEALAACARLTTRMERGLDLTDELKSALRNRTGEGVLLYTRRTLDGFAVCMHGEGSEGGTGTCFVKFGMVRGGEGAGERFERLLEAIETFAGSLGVSVEAGTNLARVDAFRRLCNRGYRTAMHLVSLQKPAGLGFNRPDVYALDDWR